MRWFHFVSDPCRWAECQVVAWVLWAIKEFSLEGVAVNNFRITGHDLCALPKIDFLSRAPPFMGDILWEHIDMLRKGGSKKKMLEIWVFTKLMSIQFKGEVQ